MANIFSWLFGSAPASSTSTAAPVVPGAGTKTPRSAASAPAPSASLPAWLKQSTGRPKAKDSITVYDMNNNPLQLTFHHEKASGGEGTVYTLPGNDQILIKVYKDQTIQNQQKLELRQKIAAMAAIKECRKMNFLAWPVMPVFDAQKQIIGFAMHRCEGKSFLALRGADNVARQFPNWDRKNLAQVALDFLRKVRLISSYGVYINDFNPANFLVDQQGKVSFIDCDSFQIAPPGRKVAISKTFFPSHCAPELLKNKSALTQVRNIHHLEFGTAIILFNLLMCGLHPYAYYDPSNKSACGNPDENLLKGRCPLGRGAGCRLPVGNWYNLWSWLTKNIKEDFINTFRDGHNNPAMRTSLEQWEEHLKQLLFEMDRIPTVPQRRQLNPMTAKSWEDHRKSAAVKDNFVMNF